AASDHRNITVEVSNSPEGVRTKSWAISPAAEAALIRLIADVFERHDLGPVRRGITSGLGVHSDYVPTECPGPWIKGRLPSIISRANQILSGTTISEEEEDIMAMDEEKLAKLVNDQTRAAIISVLQDPARYTEYTDEHGDGKRDTRSLVDIIF